MIDLSRGRREKRESAEVNMAPLIDMIFILLIFFLVTTSFTRETGVEVDRPVAASAQQLDRDALLVAVTRDGSVYIHNRGVDLLELREIVRASLDETPDKPVVILADEKSATGKLIAVMDECTIAGAKKVAVAAANER